MALQSPGVEVSVIDESAPSSSAPASIPMIFVATAENKDSANQSGVAEGTLKSNSGIPYLVTSQRELGELFGDPMFYSDSKNNMIHGGEMNEYGLQTAYSVLGVTNRAYVVRADVDLGQLGASITPPDGAPMDETYWFNTETTKFGLLEWNGASSAQGGQSFSTVELHRINSESDVVTSGGVTYPRGSMGAIGDYAVVTYTNSNRVWYKSNGRSAGVEAGEWVPVGSTKWVESIPTVRSSRTVNSVTEGEFTINGQNIIVTSTDTLSTVVTQINSNVSDVTAHVASGNILELYTPALGIELEDDSSVLMSLGMTAGFFSSPRLHIGPHTDVPNYRTSIDNADPAPTGSLWLKTTVPNGGAEFDIKQYNSETGIWQSQTSPVYQNTVSAIYNLDRNGGGKNIVPGSIYVKVNSAESQPAEVNYRLYVRKDVDRSSATSGTTAPGAGTYTFSIHESITGSSVFADPVSITVELLGDAVQDMEIVAAAINNQNFTNVQASVSAIAPDVTIYHRNSGEIRLTDETGDLMNTLFADSDGVMTAPADSAQDFVISAWEQLEYIPSASAPTSLPSDGSIWYNPIVDEVDIMVNNGEKWIGYLEAYTTTNDSGPHVGASEPTWIPNDNDLWVDTSDLENYPALKRYIDGVGWVLVDLTDQSSDLGIIFADARWSTSGDGEQPADIEDLLTSDYVDPDAPDPALYPNGMLLWNTRRSGFNVKRFVRNYIDVNGANTRYDDESMETYYPHRWVTESSNQEDGSGSFGRIAQRRTVVQALQALVNSNQRIRDDQARQFTLMACPGYPELIGEMITLNVDRRMSAFIVGDTPARLSPSATEINDWANNVAGAVEDNDKGAVSFDEYTAMYYGWGFTSDNAGNNIVVPPSHMALRTILVNDQIAYPWYAPAGTRRGGVSNATSTGYITSEGEFQTVTLTQGRRDTLYENSINPIAFISGSGLMVYGQKTRARNAMAMDRINVARLVIYIRNQLEQLTAPYIFEPNDSITRNQAKSTVDSFLLELVGLRAIDDFLVVSDSSNNTPERQSRNELWIDIAIAPLRTVEFIYVPLRLQTPDGS